MKVGEEDKKNIKSDKKIALLVLGMHRSGTSAVTGVIARLGAVGPKTQLPPAPDNPKGFAESRIVLDFNNKLLASAATNWFDIDEVNPSWFESPDSAPFEREAVDIIESEFEGAKLIALKDPRICRFPSFWINRLEAAGYHTKVIIIIRNPLDVAASLKKRNNMTEAYSLLLWLRHVLDAESATRDQERVFLGYEEVLADWDVSVARLSKELDVALPKWSSAIRNDIDQYLNADLRHNCSSDEDLLTHTRVPELVKRAYDVFRRLAKGESDQGQYSYILDEIRVVLNDICASVGPALAHGRAAEEQVIKQQGMLKVYADKLKSLHDEKEYLEARISTQSEGNGSVLQRVAIVEAKLEQMQLQNEKVRANMQEVVARERYMLEARNQELTVQADVSAKTIADLHERLKESVTNAARFEEKVAGLGREVESRFEELAKIASLLIKQRDALADMSRRNLVNEKAVLKAQQVISALETTLSRDKSTADVLKRRIAKIERSRSWRMTKPLRVLNRVVQKFLAKRT